jgi:hypothetical protein
LSRENADRDIKRGGLIADSFAIARQIAEALEEAHEKGGVHWDLKPDNIKVSTDGKVKVLRIIEAPTAAGQRKNVQESEHNFVHWNVLTCFVRVPSAQMLGKWLARLLR